MTAEIVRLHRPAEDTTEHDMPHRRLPPGWRFALEIAGIVILAGYLVALFQLAPRIADALGDPGYIEADDWREGAP